MRGDSRAVGHTKDDRTPRLQNVHHPEEKYNKSLLYMKYYPVGIWKMTRDALRENTEILKLVRQRTDNWRYTGVFWTGE